MRQPNIIPDGELDRNIHQIAAGYTCSTHLSRGVNSSPVNKISESRYTVAFGLRILPSLLLLVAIPVAGQPPANRPAPLGQLVDVGGYRVHLYCTGSGRSTVMVLGAGFSFDWGLVQPAVARFSTICTYDISGTAWSDPGPVLTCRDRVNEVHKLIRAAHLQAPLVLTGLSIGGCVARLYAAEYPSEVSGMVIVDHAFSPDPAPDVGNSHLGSDAGVDTPPALIHQAPIVVTVEQASEFNRLPVRIQKLHQWAVSLNPKLPTWDTAEDCLAQLKTDAPGPYPLGNMPLVVVSTGNQARGYDRLQNELLALSHHSIHMMAELSFHSVEIDQPEVVIAAIRQVVESLRTPSGQ
jgi:pimeloyl-ACP methyl ester carboxylesterase